MSLDLLKEIRNKTLEELPDWKQFIKIANPDDNGVSEVVLVESLIENGLAFGNGGGWVRDASTIHKYFKVEKEKRGNRIYSLKLAGFAGEDALTIDNYIPKPIRDLIKNQKCVISGTNSQVEVDHKIGAKKYQDPQDPRLKEESYYQPLCKALNNVKRENCKNCILSKVRPIHPSSPNELPYIYGNSELKVKDGEKFAHNENPCNGCFWYNPKEFTIQSKVLLLKYKEKFNKHAKYTDDWFVKEIVPKISEVIKTEKLSIEDVENVSNFIIAKL